MDVYQLAIFGAVANEYVLNVLHFQSSLTSSPTPDLDAAGLITAWQTAAEAAYLACLSQDYTLGGYQAKRINNTGGPTYIQTPPGLVGTIADNSVVSGAGAVLTAPYYQSSGTKPQWRTSRIFIPGIPATGVVKNQLQALLTTPLSAFATILNSPLGSMPTYTYGVWSKVTSQWYDITTLRTSAHIGTLRRRYKPVV